jgi:hypothetical protein
MSTEQTVTDEQLAADPQAFDAKLAGLYRAWEKATVARQRILDQIHEAAGDRKDRWAGGPQLWRRRHSEVEQAVRQMGTMPLPLRMGYGRTAAQLLEQLHESDVELAITALAVEKMETIYRRAPWPRFFPCENRDGHIHSSYRSCPTVRWDTAMAWRPDLSGRTVEEAVADLGPALCSVCFAGAPVEHKRMTMGQVRDERTRAEREAAKAARQAVKDAKQLTEAERFRTTGQFSEWVITVAKCKELIRQAIEQEVELAYYDQVLAGSRSWAGDIAHARNVRRNVADRLAELQQNAGRAASVLTRREAEHEGWGATAAEITKMQQNKYRSARREWGLA